jgi:hypothetical protein
VGNEREKPEQAMLFINNINNITWYYSFSNFPFHPPSGLIGKTANGLLNGKRKTVF